MVDDLTTGEASTFQTRTEIDKVLERPLDEEEAEQFDRDNWGLSPEAIEAAAIKDSLWGEVTHGGEVAA